MLPFSISVYTVHSASAAIEGFLRELAFKFPEPGDDPYDVTLRSWEIPPAWSTSDRQVWRRLLADENFNRLLRDFTFNFILMTQLDGRSELQLVKFSYQEYLPYSGLWLSERLGLRATELAVIAPAVGWARSYHLQIEAPQDISLTAVGLFRIQRDLAAAPLATESYEARVGADSAQVYTSSSIVPADHVVAVAMRVPMVGYMRAVWLSSLAMAFILVVGRIMISSLQDAAQTRSDAAVALLLVAPSVLAAYLIRPGEHAIVSELLRLMRAAVAVAGSLSYVATALLVLGWKGNHLRTAWSTIAGIVILIAVGMTIIVIQTKRDLARADAKSSETERREIEIVSVPRT